LEATAREKALIDDLAPWPMSNEEAWAIARKHLGDLELGYRVYRREAVDHWMKLCKIRAAIQPEKLLGKSPPELVSEILQILDEDEKGVEPCGNESQQESPPQSE
jgi:hypothetical protein